MLFQSVTADIIPQGQGHGGADKLQPAIADIHDDPISALRDLQQAAECCERHITQPYWFRCPACNLNGENGSSFNSFCFFVIRHEPMP